MIKIHNKEKCCGCHACYSSCPKQCISMKEDEEGFEYPCVDESQCVDCGLCEKVCFMQNNLKESEQPKAYAAYALDEKIRLKSSSGGIFALLAKSVIQRGGVVCGAAFDAESYLVKHIFVEEEENVQKLMTSKYVQSDIGECYKITKHYLEEGRLVLFAGTPCQINGLKAFLGKEYDNLICQDIICHGVPSAKIWKIYLRYLERKNKSKLLYNRTPNFRDKSDGWEEFAMSIPLENGTYNCVVYKDSYLRGFIHNLFLRPSCYACQSKGLSRSADITLADFWGIKKYCPEMYDEKGVSLIMIYTEKGREVWKSLEKAIKYKEVSWQEAIKGNPSAVRSVEKPEVRNYFYDRVNERNFGRMVEKNTKKPLIMRIFGKIKQKIKR
uniref:Coenzyme F420 hydrogenase/dehydrogenase, beta subunit C-terminal domain n=1 Tax=Acetatifactor sp. TaxID=1872090 RepID=UPI0040569A25